MLPAWASSPSPTAMSSISSWYDGGWSLGTSTCGFSFVLMAGRLVPARTSRTSGIATGSGSSAGLSGQTSRPPYDWRPSGTCAAASATTQPRLERRRPQHLVGPVQIRQQVEQRVGQTDQLGDPFALLGRLVGLDVAL